MPTITGALGIVPKLFWPITKKKRAQMYYELSERRNSMVSDYVSSVSETESKMKVTVKADIPFMLKAMVSGPLQDGVEKIAAALAAVPYV